MISIIIPIYNTPIDCIERCLRSIVEQTYSDWEVIIINDGSTKIQDNDIVNCYKHLLYCQKFRVIHQNNQGVSCARNTGIKRAAGEFIIFVDADDIISSNFLEEALEYENLYSADIVIGNIEYSPKLKNNKLNNQLIVLQNENVADLKKALLGIQQESIPYPILGTPCGRLYRTHIVKKIGFCPGIALCEDQIFNRQYFEYINSAVIVPSTWYTYFQNDFSAMHHEFEKKYIDRIKPFWNKWNELNKSETNQKTQKILYRNSISLYYSAIRQGIVPKAVSWKCKKAEMKKLLEERIFQDSLGALAVSDMLCLKDKVSYLCLKTLIISKKPGNTGKSRDKDTEFTTHLLHSEGTLTRCPFP